MGKPITNTCSKPPTITHHVGVNGGAIEKKSRLQKEQVLNCPRCNSNNTKFCYYNNYSLTQPRYFCKTGRRYWTEGGSLKNIPVGCGSRKNKKQSSSSSKTKFPDLVTPLLYTAHLQNPSKIHEGQDLNLAYQSTQGTRAFSTLISLHATLEKTKNSTATTAADTPSCQVSGWSYLLGFLQEVCVPLYLCKFKTSGFISPTQDFKPSLSFSLDGVGTGGGSGGGNGGGYGNLQESNGTILFPFEDLKQESNTTRRSDQIQQNRDDYDDHHHHNQGGSRGYWTGMLGGGSW